MESLSDWLIGLFASWTTVAQVAVVFLAIVVVIGVAVMTNLKWGKIIVTGLAAAVVVMLVNGGITLFSDRLNTEVNTAPASHTIQLTSDEANVWSLPELAEPAV
ncbi:hypothetical protein [Microbacterium rhizomatis]|uniref:Uncharacterized protein n=1 Tax=Microbacterium rhizomatis TaxID=1631477 RepID=A0A5J5IZ98_9MICO|nr:hypothetical protein [Microbacterium rhizomatis]KAA9105993.1 hypothetical protein F6B43_16680 [Microbacterium rhizomatis]